MEDSWQEVRILYILKGTSLTDEITATKNLINDNAVPSITTHHHVYEAGQSFFDIFAKLKSSHQKRGYQFIKNLVHLFSKYALSRFRSISSILFSFTPAVVPKPIICSAPTRNSTSAGRKQFTGCKNNSRCVQHSFHFDVTSLMFSAPIPRLKRTTRTTRRKDKP